MSTQAQTGAGLKKWGIFITTLIASITVIMNNSLQEVAVPLYIEIFQIPTLNAQWIVSLFSLTFLISLTIAPYLAKKFGYRNVFFFGLILLTTGAIIGGFAPAFNVMLLARVFQGAGGGLIMPICLVILREGFGHEQQGFAMGLWSFSGMIAQAFGPTIGGIILENSSWNYLFFANIPVVIFCLIATIVFVKGNIGKIDGAITFDWIGFILISVGLVSLVFAIEQIQKANNVLIPAALFIVAVICLTTFVFHSLRAKEPIINIRIMKNSLFTASLIITICCAFTMTSLVFIIPLLMQQVLNVGPTLSGLAALPHAVMVGVFGIVGGKLLDRYGAKSAVYPGLFILLGVSLFFYFSLNSIPIWAIIVCIVLIGIGNGMLSTTTVATALSNLKQDQLGEGSSMVNISKHLGKVIIVVVVAFILDSRRTQYLAENYETSAAIVASIQDVYLFLAGFLVLMIPVVWLICKKYNEKSGVAKNEGTLAKEETLVKEEETQLQS